jgi:hypothetical protein
MYIKTAYSLQVKYCNGQVMCKIRNNTQERLQKWIIPNIDWLIVYSLIVFKCKDIGIVINIENFYNILTSNTIHCFKHILNTQIFIVLI